MKRLFSIQLVFLHLAIMLSGCINDVERTDPHGIYSKVSFVASLDESSTKTALNTATGKVFWQEGDLIRYYSANEGSVSTYNVNSIMDGGTAQIDLLVGLNSTFAVAVHGGTGIADRENNSCTIQGAITAEQSGRFDDSHVAVAKVRKVNGKWPETIQFSNIIPFISFELEGTACGADYALFKSGANERLHADGQLYVSFDGTDVDEINLPSQGGGSSIQIPISGANVYYIALAPGVYHGFNLSFYKKNAVGVDEYIGTVSSEKTLSLSNRKSLVKLGTVDSKIKRVSTDLGAAGEANCYVVSEPGDYKFPVNSATAAATMVVWESTMTAEAPDAGKVVYNLELKDGYLHFASGVDGNAVIAVTDDEDAILWSWHIWVCKGIDLAASAITTAGIKVMDRVLGALDDKSSGLLYQWGRKDPFLADGIASTPAFKAPITSTEKNGTVAKAIRYPSTLINPDVVTEGDWLYAGHDNSLWSNVKTDYDPCPTGWHVPSNLSGFASSWPDGFYWSYEVSGSKAIRFSNQKAVPSGRATLSMVRCVAGNIVEVAGVSLDKSSVTINPGESVTLSASIFPANASVQKVTWTVNPAGVVSVQTISDNEIQVTGVSEGECVIRATAHNGISAVCQMNVVKKVPSVISAHVYDIDPFVLLCDPEPDPADPADFYSNWEQYCYRKQVLCSKINSILEQTVGVSCDQLRSKFNWDSGKTYYRKNQTMLSSDDYGRIIYVKDSGSGGANDKFVFLFRKTNYEKFKSDYITEKEIYAHFVSDEQDELWLGFKISIVDGPKVVFSQKKELFWLDDLLGKGYEQNIRISVKVPTYGDDDINHTPPVVTRYSKFFDDNWVNNEVRLALDLKDNVSKFFYYPIMDAKQVPKYLWDQYNANGYLTEIGTMPVRYEYFFNSKQDDFKYMKDSKSVTARFYVSYDRKRVYLDAAMTKLVAEITCENYVTNNGVNVFNPTKDAYKITYACNDWTKELLNAYEYKTDAEGHTLNSVSEMLYFKIDLQAYYGDCYIPWGNYTFPARFIRPITINTCSDLRLKDGEVYGSNVEFGQLFSAYDWQGNAVLSYKNYQYVEGAANGVNLYRYFGIDMLSLDVEKAKTDQNGGVYHYLFDQYNTNSTLVERGVNNNARLWVAYKYAPQTPVIGDVSINQVSNLANYILHYESDSGVVNDYHIEIPYTVSYHWGVVSGTLIIPVEHAQSF